MTRVRLVLPALLCLAVARPALAFCGFYVAKADASLYNHGSQVVIARDGDRTVLTISNDFKGPLNEFAEVVPVPALITREQVHIGDRRLLERIDGYSAPRLVEYHDPDPCSPPMRAWGFGRGMGGGGIMGKAEAVYRRADSFGVKIEAEYSVGEYDIVILSAKQSTGLEDWLVAEGYRIPPKAAAALEPYVKQAMKFFVAKVNLKAQQSTGFTYLRPIQIAYESDKFMLPIRLGMANSEGTQDLTIYTLTRSGRVESTNYRTVELPTGEDVPTFVKDDFKAFYRALFTRAWEKEDRKAVFTEYAWDGGWCDPCADQPLSREELRGLGVFWLDDDSVVPRRWYGRRTAPIVTRLHVRYDAADFPEDLVFQETGNRQNYQARYVLRWPFRGALDCEAGQRYLGQLDERRPTEARTLADLTGWELPNVLEQRGDGPPGRLPKAKADVPWYRRLWGN
ncbi:MAG TPA: DUF2330 domain-containing protein [Myxococcales bacterium]|nr:DUF2330 domain-containing protein [Myxococcales bacterium]